MCFVVSSLKCVVFKPTFHEARFYICCFQTHLLTAVGVEVFLFLAFQQERHSPLERSVEDAVEDRILRAVGVAEQEGEREDDKCMLCVAPFHKIDVQVADVVGQPGHGKQDGNQQEHPGDATSTRHHAVLGPGRVLLVPQRLVPMHQTEPGRHV